MVNNTPVTPLPWLLDQYGHVYGMEKIQIDDRRRAPLGYIQQSKYIIGRDTSVSFAERRYVVHTANAYPRLIEALRDAHAALPGGSWVHIESKLDCRCKGCMKKRIPALLLELGEDN